MFTLNLTSIFTSRGIEKPYSFLVKAGFPSHTAHRLLHGDTRNFKLDHIEKLCKLFICTPNELLVWTPNRNEIIPDDHPIKQLKKETSGTAKTWNDTLKDIPLKDLPDILQIIDQKKTAGK